MNIIHPVQRINWIYLGKIKYGESMKIQQILLSKRLKNRVSDTILLMEHDPVFTIGKRSVDIVNNINYLDEGYIQNLKSKGADFFQTSRGGLITFHGPGQLVAYPILDLQNYQKDLRWYSRILQKCMVSVCKTFGIPASISDRVGVLVDDKKIGSVGFSVLNWITSHGLALNVSNDLSWFSHIIPCGNKEGGITSMKQQLDQDIPLIKVVNETISQFGTLLSSEMVPLSTLGQLIDQESVDLF
jgi:lipoyl(octanoyl) transferase 2